MRSTLWHGVLPKARIRLREGKSGRRMPGKFASSFSVASILCIRVYVKFMSEYMPNLCQSIYVKFMSEYIQLLEPQIYIYNPLLSSIYWAPTEPSFFLSLLYLPSLCKVDLRQQISKGWRCQELSRRMNASKSPNRWAHWHGVSQKKCLRLFGQSWPDTFFDGVVCFLIMDDNGMFDDLMLMIHDHILRDPLPKWKGTTCSWKIICMYRYKFPEIEALQLQDCMVHPWLTGVALIWSFGYWTLLNIRLSLTFNVLQSSDLVGFGGGMILKSQPSCPWGGIPGVPASQAAPFIQFLFLTAEVIQVWDGFRHRRRFPEIGVPLNHPF